MTTSLANSQPLANAGDWKRLAGVGSLGFVLLLGRFNWGSNLKLAVQGYTMSGFMFLLLLIGSFAYVCALGECNRIFWRWLTVAAVLLNFPLHWTFLHRFYYTDRFPQFYARQPHFISEWIGASPPWTLTDSFFCILLGSGIAIFALWSWTQRRKRPSWRIKTSGTIFGLFVLILAQVWLHNSGRSPYSYVPHFEQPADADYTSTLSLLPNDHGLANADVNYYTRLEEFFLGTRVDTPTLFVRRAFTFYLSGNLSYFIGPFFSFLIINTLLWTAAVVAFYHLARRLADSRLALYAALFMAGSPGFIMFAAQPMSYFSGYAAVIFMLYGLERMLSADSAKPGLTVAAMGCILATAMLTTDLFVWLPAVVLFAVALRRSWQRTALSCILALGIYGAYLGLVFGLLALPKDDLNSKQLNEAVAGALQLLRTAPSHQLYLLFTDGLGIFIKQLAHVFFIIPVALACLGLFLAEINPKARRVAAVCLLPAFGTFFVMHLGQSYLGTLPRFNFMSYPGIYLLAGGFLAWGETLGTREGRGGGGVRPARIGCIGIAAGCLVISNLDAFGIFQSPYYYFYYSNGGFFPK